MKSGIPLHSDEKYIGRNVNCYCFNPNCTESILNAKNYLPVKMLLSVVLTEKVCCQACGEELVSQPLLEIKCLVHDSFSHITANAA
jgi:hypothetical protein